jgi:hypothetical protein
MTLDWCCAASPKASPRHAWRALGCSGKQLHTVRQRVQAHVNATAPTGVMTGTAVEADERYQNAGGKKHAAS